MPGIPLLNLGTALGGLAGGWNQARSQGLQQAIQQLALQQAQGQTNQQTLANLALKAGLLNQGGGQTPLQAATGAVPNQTAPAPTQMASSGGGPQVSPSSGMPMPQGYTYTPPAPMSPYGPPGAPTTPGDMTSADEVQLNADAGQDQFGATNQAITAAGFGNQTASSGGSDATPSPTPTPIPTPSPASSDSGQGSGGGSVGMQFGNGPPIDMSTMFQRLDYQKLAQGIAQLAPPGTSQADIYGAVVDLAKLAEGDKTQQQQAAYMLKLLGIQGNLVAIDKRGAYQTGIAQGHDATKLATTTQTNQTRTALADQADATKRYIADQAAQLKQAGMQARSAVQWTQIAQKNQQLAQQLNIAGQREAAQAISQQLRALQARIATFKPGPDGNFTDDQQKQLQAINDQIASIGAKVGAQQGAGP